MPNRRELVLYLLAWLLPSAALAGMVVSTSDSNWGYALVFAMPLALMYAFAIRFSAFYVCRAFPLSAQNLFATVGVLGLVALLFGAFWAALAHLWNDFWLVLEKDGAGIVPFSSLLGWLIFSLGVSLYGLSVVVNYLLIEFERVRQAERRMLESKMMAQEAELRMLRTQIDPHFLFNSLNSISALTSINPAMAREMTQQLADFFRYSLGLEAQQKVTLEDEMRLVMHFLAIEKVRFGERLQIEQSITPAAAACLVPPMIIQPLVENAVKHGIGHLMQGGTLRISAVCTATQLHIRVLNDVDGDSPKPAQSAQSLQASHGRGIGLKNVRQRLQTSYLHHASVYWARSDDAANGQVFVVDVRLPIEKREE